MTETGAQQIVRLVLSGDLDPIVAAEQLLASGGFMVGTAGFSVDIGGVTPDEALRFQAFMGRLMWEMVAGGALGLPKPATLEEYRDFFARAMTHDDETVAES